MRLAAALFGKVAALGVHGGGLRAGVVLGRYGQIHQQLVFDKREQVKLLAVNQHIFFYFFIKLQGGGLVAHKAE